MSRRELALVESSVTAAVGISVLCNYTTLTSGGNNSYICQANAATAGVSAGVSVTSPLEATNRSLCSQAASQDAQPALLPLAPSKPTGRAPKPLPLKLSSPPAFPDPKVPSHHPLAGGHPLPHP